jgi:pantoate--beta-alanine ligase
MTKVIRSIPEMMKFSASMKKKGFTIGFVPTMGYLHEGHLSLVRRARKKCDRVVVSVFVNPAQFGPKEDLKVYPRDFGRDRKLLSKERVDAIFYPTAKAMYPDGYGTYIYVNGSSDVVCGASRPGHFRGVATVVAKLFNIVKPDIAYFGKKDFQQQVIIKKMVKDMDLGVRIVAMPTVREKDGLAMSSRNKYLTGDERVRAAVINRALHIAGSLVKAGEKDAGRIRSAVSKLIRSKGLKIDYVAVCDPSTLEEKKTIKGRALIAVAAFMGRTRLIDNVEVY